LGDSLAQPALTGVGLNPEVHWLDRTRIQFLQLFSILVSKAQW